MTPRNTEAPAVNGSSAQRPTRCAVVPTSHGRAAPPAMLVAIMMPIAVLTSGPATSRGAVAIVTGKSGPRKYPTTMNPAAAPSADGTAQTISSAAVTAPMQAPASPTTPTPSRSAMAFNVRRPIIRPNQYPLTTQPAARTSCPRPSVRKLNDQLPTAPSTLTYTPRNAAMSRTAGSLSAEMTLGRSPSSSAGPTTRG